MVETLRLLLPVLFPSWRFFDVIAPSPRIEVAFLDTPASDGEAWIEARPRPERRSLGDLLVALFWNPRWNESLYLATCAERLMQNPTEHSSREIRRRLRPDLPRLRLGEPMPPFFRFRLVFVSREDERPEKAGEDRLRRDVTFVSPAYPTVDSPHP